MKKFCETCGHNEIVHIATGNGFECRWHNVIKPPLELYRRVPNTWRILQRCKCPQVVEVVHGR